MSQISRISGDEERKPLLLSSPLNLDQTPSVTTPQSPPEVKRTNRRTRERTEGESSSSVPSYVTKAQHVVMKKNYDAISSTVSTSTSSTASTIQDQQPNKQWNATSDSNADIGKSFKLLLWLVAALSIGYHLGYSTIRARLVMTRTKPAHQQPTLLSIVDPQTMDYVRARSFYSQYNQWKLNMKPPINLLSIDPPHHQQAPLKLELDKTKMHSPREPLTLSWERVAKHHSLSEDDLIVLYCASSTEEIVKTMEIATIAQAKATSQKHSPKQWYQRHRYEWVIPAFPVVRESHCWFTLYSTTSKNDNYLVLAHSPILELFLKEKPANVHLARGDDPSKMRVHFSTGQQGQPVALFGMGTDLSGKVEGTTTTFQASDMCSGPANETDTGKFADPGFLHTIEFTGLVPNTVYSYKVGLTFGQGVVWSDVFEFISPATTDYFKEGNGNVTYTYLVYGDQGCPAVGWGEGSRWSAAMVTRETSAREVHHIGDLSYARGATHIWDEWLAMVSGSFATKLPLMVAVGNHEYDHTMGGDHGKDPSGSDEVHGFMPTWGNMGDDSGGECGVPTSKHFQMPVSSLGSNGVFWYSYHSANVHTIVLSSEHDLSSSSVQYQWLEADLSTVNRTVTPWIVVELHRPLYFNEALWPDVAVGIGMRQEFENLLGWYGVDLVVAGHVHSYFRSCAGLWHSQCDNGGPTHLVVGAAGAVLDNAPTYSQSWAVKNIQGLYGYGRITVHNDTWLHFQFVQAGPDDDKHAGDVLDEVWITHSSTIA